MKGTFVITILVIVALVATFIAFRSGPENSGAAPDFPLEPREEWEAAVDGHQEAVPPGFVPWNVKDAERRIAAGVADLPSLDSAAAAKLVESATTILDSYWSSDPKKLVNYYRSTGLENLVLNLEGSARQDRMDKATRSVKAVPVSLDRMTVRWFIRDGKRVSDERPKGWQVAAVIPGQPRGDADIIDPEQPGVDVVTVNMPAQMLDASTGAPFIGNFLLYFARHTGETRWLLFRVESRNRLAAPPIDTPNAPRIYFPPV